MTQDSESDWMLHDTGVFIDIHSKLKPFDDVLSFFTRVEIEFDVLKYCNGANIGGRWIYQIYSQEFIFDVSQILNRIIDTTQSKGPILEVMSGDGKLSEFLQSYIDDEIVATDSKNGRDNIEYPKWVEKLDAIEAIHHYSPKIILMSWEPFYSDISSRIIELEIPTLWIGDPSKSAVGTGLESRDYIVMRSEHLLGRNDSFVNREFRTEIRLFNYHTVRNY